MNKKLFSGFSNILLLALMVLSLQAVQAQKDKVSTAEMKLTNNELDLIDAKKAIDEAAVFETTKTLPYMYLVKGKVYQRIYNSPIAQVKDLSKDAAYISAESYLNFFNSPVKKKAFEMEDAKGTFLQSAVDAYNDHIRLLNEDNYTDAIRNLRMVKALLPYDDQKLLEQNNLTAGKLTFAMYSAAYAKKDTVLQEKFLLDLVAMNYPDLAIYSILARLYLDQNKPYAAIKYINLGLDIKFDDPALIREKINYYISKNATDTLLTEINTVIDRDPDNPDNSQFYYIRGNLYEQTKNPDAAMASYTKALELNPDNFDASYNLGALFLNQANDLYKTIGVNGVTKASVDIKMKDLYVKAKPYLEKALSNDDYPNSDKLTLSKNLKRIYDNLGETENSKRMVSLIELYQN